MLKYASHVIAGVAYWLGNGEGTFLGVADNSALFSFVYNGAYCIPNIIIGIAIIIAIISVMSFDKKSSSFLIQYIFFSL